MTLAVVVAVGMIAAGARAEPFSGMVVFGDSLSDTGNLFTFTGEAVPASPPYFQGRFSNGPVWVEHLLSLLDVDPDLLVNFATGGATSGTTNITASEAPGLLTQIDAFAASGSPVDPEALYVVWAGANDFLGNVADPEAAITTAVTNIATAISTLAALGASTILVPNLPDLGKVPEIRESGDAALIAGATALVVAFNDALAATLDNLAAMLEIDLIPLDVFALLEDIVADPAAFDLVNVTDRCLSADQTTICDTPEQHLFWDGDHPTAAGHSLLADAAAADLIDSNGDGIPDSRALALGLDPLVEDGDSDADGTSDVDEVGDLDNPLDTDGDGIIDAVEPGDAASDPLALVFRVPDMCCRLSGALVGGTVSLTATGASAMGSINNANRGLPVYSEGQVRGVDLDFDYPLGLYSFTLMVPNGGTATVVLQLPADVTISANAVYRKVETAGNFSTFSAAVIDRVNKTVTLTLTDGGAGDEDGSANGVIMEPGGVGEPFSFENGSFFVPEDIGSPCFIATAAYGSYEAPYVQILRNFRDRFLLPNAAGRWLVAQYYTYSPPAAAWIVQREGWRAIVRIVLLPLIGAAWLLTEAAPGMQTLVGLLLLGLLLRTTRHLRTRRMSIPPEA
jgi:phospholipase/lecithinase/hemolysin